MDSVESSEEFWKAEYDVELFSYEVMHLFPKIPEEDYISVLWQFDRKKKQFQSGYLSRAFLIVNAHVRHSHTEYDRIMGSFSDRDFGHAIVKQHCMRVLESWGYKRGMRIHDSKWNQWRRTIMRSHASKGLYVPKRYRIEYLKVHDFLPKYKPKPIQPLVLDMPDLGVLGLPEPRPEPEKPRKASGMLFLASGDVIAIPMHEVHETPAEEPTGPKYWLAVIPAPKVEPEPDLLDRLLVWLWMMWYGLRK